MCLNRALLLGTSHNMKMILHLFMGHFCKIGCFWYKWYSNLTLNMRGPSYLGLTKSISWLLMPWLLTSPGHQQPWYWLCKIGRFLSYLRKDFNRVSSHEPSQNSLTFPWPFCGFPWPWDILSAFHYCLNTNFASNLTNHSPKVAITK